MRVEFDPEKEAYNLRKHGFDFSLAERLLNSDFVIDVYDRFENGEHRYHAFALLGQRVLLVVHSDPAENDDIIRVFGPRRATASESKRYEAERKAAYRT